mgnify:CR=1 FL=1
MFARLSSKVFTGGKPKATCNIDAQLEELAAQSVSTEEPADETHSNSEASASTCSPKSQADFNAAAEEGMVWEEPPARCVAWMDGRDENGEPGVGSAVSNAAENEAEIVRDGPVPRPTPASQTGDAQARRRALKRYKEDAGGQFVKGRAGDGGHWIPEPNAATFPTLELAMEHERHKTLLRRATWVNLRGDIAGTRRAVTEEGARTRHHQTMEAEETRRSVEDARDALTAKVEEGVKAICAQKQECVRDSSSASKISFYSMVFSNLRAQDMKDLLNSRGIEPLGTKSMLAQLVVAHLTEEDVEEFVISRSGKRRRFDVPSGNQQTLDVLFNAGTGRSLDQP